ncbi:hypothetical protein VPH35_115975 [Triticum aestivum]
MHERSPGPSLAATRLPSSASLLLLLSLSLLAGRSHGWWCREDDEGCSLMGFRGDDSPVTGGGISEKGRFSYGFASCAGKRASMEDFYETRVDDVDGETVGLFGVFDGHGGARAAEYVKKHLFSNLIKHPKFMTDTKAAIGMPIIINKLLWTKIFLPRQSVIMTSLCFFSAAETFNHTDSEFLKADSSHTRDAGSTASTAILVGGRLVVANVGDSRAVVSKGGKAIAVSRDHKPDQTDERQRIEEAGGFVMWAGIVIRPKKLPTSPCACY